MEKGMEEDQGLSLESGLKEWTLGNLVCHKDLTCSSQSGLQSVLDV